jgi:hypothetical protein
LCFFVEEDDDDVFVCLVLVDEMKALLLLFLKDGWDELCVDVLLLMLRILRGLSGIRVGMSNAITFWLLLH